MTRLDIALPPGYEAFAWADPDIPPGRHGVIAKICYHGATLYQQPFVGYDEIDDYALADFAIRRYVAGRETVRQLLTEAGGELNTGGIEPYIIDHANFDQLIIAFRLHGDTLLTCHYPIPEVPSDNEDIETLWSEQLRSALAPVIADWRRLTISS